MINYSKIKLLWDCHRATLVLLLFTVFFTLIPMIVRILYTIPSDNWSGILDLLIKSQIYLQSDLNLYSIAFLCPTIYIFVEHKKEMWDSRIAFALLSFCILVVDIIAYVILVATNNNIVENSISTQYVSTFIFLYAIIMFYCASYIQRRENESLRRQLDLYDQSTKLANVEIDPREKSNKEISDLLKEL